MAIISSNQFSYFMLNASCVVLPQIFILGTVYKSSNFQLAYKKVCESGKRWWSSEFSVPHVLQQTASVQGEKFRKASEM